MFGSRSFLWPVVALSLIAWAVLGMEPGWTASGVCLCAGWLFGSFARARR